MAQERGMGRENAHKHSRLRPIGNTHFLGIGINTYTHWPILHNAVRDVKAVAQLLMETYGISSTTLLFDKVATRKNILAELERLANDLKTPDSLIIYYAGHGHLNNRKRGFWVPVDAAKKGIDQYIANSTLRDYIGDIPSLHTLLISDACFSGSLFVRGAERSGNLALSELAHLPSRWAICSGRHDEAVADGAKDEHSPFAQSILDVLGKSERAAITANFLYEQVRFQTRSNYTQLPDGGPLQNVGHKRGEYVFVKPLNEQTIWKDSKATGTIVAYQSYLDTFPEGQYAETAKQLIANLRATLAWQHIEHLPEETLVEINAKRFGILDFCQEFLDSTHYPAAVALGKQLDFKKEFKSNYHSLFGLMEISKKTGPFQNSARERLAELQTEQLEERQNHRVSKIVIPLKKQTNTTKQKTLQENKPKYKDHVKKIDEPAEKAWLSWLKLTTMILSLLLILIWGANKYRVAQDQREITTDQLERIKESSQAAFTEIDTAKIISIRNTYQDYLPEKRAQENIKHIDEWLVQVRDSLAAINSSTYNVFTEIANNMVRIDGGTFIMGCQDSRDTNCDANEKPAHIVNVSNFYISKYEVTQKQWRAVMGDDPEELYNKGCDQCPVEKISWNDVQTFLQQLNTKSQQKYRLPKEEEWEYAARERNKSEYTYSGSNEIDEVAWYYENAKVGNKKTTQPVGTKRANELGLFDMSGNVSEWCSYIYVSYPMDTKINTEGASSKDLFRVFRGGGWRSSPKYCRVANRNGAPPSDRYNYVGFRLAHGAQ